MLHPDSRRIDLWCAFCDSITDEATLGLYYPLLNDPERVQQARFYFPRDRHRYLITRALVRTTLSMYADIPAGSWRFGQNAHGRPEIQNELPLARELSFNISHTNKLVVLGITRNRALGVDTENAATREAHLHIADRYFAPDEVTALRALALEQQPRRFFQLWTLKESYIKARGMGLSIPLDQFGFQFAADGRIGFRTDAVLQDEAARWQFWQMTVESGHLLAVCAENRGEPPPTLSVRRIVPLVSQTELHYTLLAASAGRDPA